MTTQIMDKLEYLSNDSFCYGCLCKRDDKILLPYNMKNKYLKTIIQSDTINLCYMCKRMAQHSELFIGNVQKSQAVLNSYQHISFPALLSLKTEIQPLCNLSIATLPAIELDCPNDQDYTYDPDPIVYSSHIDIKMELDDEDEGDRDIQSDINDSDDLKYPLIAVKELKTEDELRTEDAARNKEDDESYEEYEGIHDGDKLKDLNVVKPSRGRSEKSEFDENIENITISHEKCMEERAAAAKDELFLSSAYKCEDCVKGYNFKAGYERHMQKHSETRGKYQCDICKVRLISALKLQVHYRYHTRRYRCRVCHITRSDKMTVRDHYAVTHSEGNILHKCPHCPKTYKRQTSLKDHVFCAHKTKERVQCMYCDKNYTSKKSLKVHMISAHSNEVSGGKTRAKRHVCPDCGMSFSSPSHLRNHSVKHSDRRDYYCVECDKSFKSDAMLQHHLKVALPHVTYMQLPLQCEHCPKRFAAKKDLSIHSNAVHLKTRAYQCDKCEKTYTRPQSLYKHKKFAHMGYKYPRKYPCTYCDKVFRENRVLKCHLRTHTGERPFQCSQCSAQFTQPGTLTTHIKLVHLKMTRNRTTKGKTRKTKRNEEIDAVNVDFDGMLS